MRRLREWPRAVAGALLVAAVLVGIGLLVGSQALGSGGSTRTVTTTATTTVRQTAAATASPALAGARRQITTLRSELARTHRRLDVARRRLAAAHASHPHTQHPTHRR